MAKRFIDTDLFRKPFMRGLDAPYKALWIYLLCECDHAGVWVVELDVAQLRTDLKLDPDKVFEKMGGAVVPVGDGSKWYLPDFVAFQYGTLNRANRVHASVLDRLEALGIDPNEKSEKKGLASPLQGAKDKEKDKDTQERKERARDSDWFKEQCRITVDAHPDVLDKSERAPFYDYWTESSTSGKMRFEAQKFFDFKRRMQTWQRNAENKPFKGNGAPAPMTRAEAMEELRRIRERHGIEVGGFIDAKLIPAEVTKAMRHA
jgi:hypothetical protein